MPFDMAWASRTFNVVEREWEPRMETSGVGVWDEGNEEDEEDDSYFDIRPFVLATRRAAAGRLIWNMSQTKSRDEVVRPLSSSKSRGAIWAVGTRVGLRVVHTLREWRTSSWLVIVQICEWDL